MAIFDRLFFDSPSGAYVLWCKTGAGVVQCKNIVSFSSMVTVA
jgi:hypothetical protein